MRRIVIAAPSMPTATPSASASTTPPCRAETMECDEGPLSGQRRDRAARHNEERAADLGIDDLDRRFGAGQRHRGLLGIAARDRELDVRNLHDRAVALQHQGPNVAFAENLRACSMRVSGPSVETVSVGLIAGMTFGSSGASGAGGASACGKGEARTAGVSGAAGLRRDGDGLSVRRCRGGATPKAMAAPADRRRAHAGITRVLFGAGAIAVTLPRNSARNQFLTKELRDHVGITNRLPARAEVMVNYTEEFSRRASSARAARGAPAPRR